MAAVPPGLDRAEIELYLAGLPGVVSVHDLHIWAMSTTETALTAHIVRQAAVRMMRCCTRRPSSCGTAFKSGTRPCRWRTGDPAYPCRLAPDHVV